MTIKAGETILTGDVRPAYTMKNSSDEFRVFICEWIKLKFKFKYMPNLNWLKLSTTGWWIWIL